MDAGRLFGGDLLVVLLHNTITRFPHLALVSFLLCVSHPSVLLIVGEAKRYCHCTERAISQTANRGSDSSEFS